MAKRNSKHSRSHKTPAVAYYRMSSDKQEASIPAQMKAVERYAEEHGYEIIRDYRDEAISGDATEKRLDFQRMIRDVASGDFKVILCWDQDRFGRFDPIEGGYWIKPIRDAGVRLETVSHGAIDWDDFSGRIVWTVHQEAKHSYLSDLSRNVLRGHVAAAQDGKWLGRAPIGYQVDPDGKRLVLGDTHRVELVRRIFRDYLEPGGSLRSIADSLNSEGVPSPANRNDSHWSGNGVRAILVNRVYLGEFVWNKTSRAKYHRCMNGRPERAKPNEKRRTNDESQRVVIPDNHPAIIDPQMFKQAQEKLDRNKSTATTHRDSAFLLTGLVVCDNCGAKMHGLTDGKRKYSCSGYTKHGPSHCHRNSVAEEKVLSLVCNAVENDFLSTDRLEQLREDIRRQCRSNDQKAQVQALERSLKHVEGKLHKSKRRLLEVDSDMLDAVQEQVRHLRSERERIDKALQAALTPEDRLLADRDRRIAQAIDIFHRLREAMHVGDSRLVRDFLSQTVREVRLHFHGEQRGAKRFNFVDRGTITLSGSLIAGLCSPLGRTSLGGITGATMSDSLGS